MAVKIPHAGLEQDPTARAAFQNEGRVGARVQAPGLVRILWSGEARLDARDPLGPVLVMLYVPGETLSDVLAEGGPLPEPLLRSVAAQVAEGLAALHAAGYVHGDVKPDNMRLDASGRAVLTDLGFARAASGSVEVNDRAGSLAYLSPDRVKGRPATPADDVFALGVVMYELATGRHPFADLPRKTAGSSRQLAWRGGGTPEVAEALLRALSEAHYVPPSRRAPWLSPFLDRLLREVLAAKGSMRPSAAELGERLEQQESGPWWKAQLEGGAELLASSWYLTPLVGREGELAALREAWATVARRQVGGAVWLTGAAGSGKSRLLSEFADRARTSATPPIYLEGRCRTLVAQRPCAAVLELLQRWLGLPRGSAPSDRERGVLEQSVPPSSARTLLQALDPQWSGEQSGAVPPALAEWLLALASKTPVLAFLDDLNFADEGTLAVLSLVGQRLDEGRLLLVLGEREHEQPSRPEPFERLKTRLLEAGARRIALPLLDRRAVLELVNRLFHHTAPRRHVAEVLWDKSRGNAGLLIEILRELTDRGKLYGEPGHWRLGIEPGQIPLPRSLGTLINERFRRLSPFERSWLRRLSVVGGRLEPDFLERAFPETSASEMVRLLTRLVNAGWLVPLGSRFRFARPALRESVYRSTPAPERIATHLAAARALAPDEKGRIQLLSALQRAYHLHAAGEHEALLRALPPLIDAMLRRGQPQRVVTLARWGLEALANAEARPSTRRLRLGFLEAAADAADRLGQREQQRAWLDQLGRAELSPDESPAELSRVYMLHGRFAAATGHYALAADLFRNAVDLARRASVSNELESEALRRLAAVQAHVGELEEARRLAEGALEKAAHDAQRAVAWIQCGIVALLEDRFGDAFSAADRALRLLRVDNDWRLPGIGAAAQMLRGRTYRGAGRPRRALGSMRRALRLARQAGERRLEAEIAARLGGLLLDVDRVADAEAHLREALTIARDIHDRRGETLAALWLGILLWEQEDPEAEPRIDWVVRQAAELELGRVEALARAIRARIERDSGRLDEALADSDRSMALVELRGSELADRIVILGTRVLVLEDVGRKDEARELARHMERSVRRVNQRIKHPVTRRRHSASSKRLLRAVLDREGVIYPRLRDPDDRALDQAGS